MTTVAQLRACPPAMLADLIAGQAAVWPVGAGSLHPSAPARLQHSFTPPATLRAALLARGPDALPYFAFGEPLVQIAVLLDCEPDAALAALAPTWRLDPTDPAQFAVARATYRTALAAPPGSPVRQVLAAHLGAYLPALLAERVGVPA